MRSERKATLGRRQFLRALGAGALGAGALGAGAAATAAAPFATDAMAHSETNDVKRKSRYRASDHVKEYYRVNRYPS